MKISDLAALVTVRNHILTVIGDKSVTTRDEFKPLNDARTKLDKKFVEIVKGIDVDVFFVDNNPAKEPTQKVYIKELPPQFKFPTIEQLELPLDIDISQPMEGVWDDSIDSGSPQTLGAEPSTFYGIKTVKEPKPEIDEAAAAEEQASISKKIQEQKELLKKQGRSNKRISSGKKE